MPRTLLLPPPIVHCLALSLGLLAWVAPPLAAPLASRPAGVWVVDAAGGADFGDIQSAVDAALSDDTILVRPGAYPGFSIRGKGLAVVRFGDGEVLCEAVTVGGTGRGESIVLSGLTIPAPPSHRSAVELNGCQGPVRIQGCRLRGADGLVAAALRAQASSDVLVVDGDLQGGSADTYYYSEENGESGAYLLQSNLYLYRSRVRGGDGGYFPAFPCLASTLGGRGMLLNQGARAFIAATEVRGGDAVDDADYGRGGNGIAVVTHSAVARSSTFAAGAPSSGFLCAAGLPSEAIVGPVEVFREPLRTFIAAALVVREHRSASLEVVGEPGDAVRLLVSDSTVSLFKGAAAGYRHAPPSLPGGALDLGTVPEGGTLRATWRTPSVPGGEALRVSLQAVATNSIGEARFLEAYSIVVLDDAFYLARVPPTDTTGAPRGAGRSAQR